MEMGFPIVARLEIGIGLLNIFARFGQSNGRLIGCWTVAGHLLDYMVDYMKFACC